MTARKTKTRRQVLTGGERAECIACGEMPMVIVRSAHNPRLGICGGCASRAVAILRANAADVAAFERAEKKARAALVRVGATP